jgi:hypothetical protein
MKLEFLSGLLEKPTTELEATYNVSDPENVQDDVLKKVFTDHIKEIRISALSEGKKQGEGMAKRTVLSQAEKTLKDAFEVDGSNFDEILENLKVKKFDSKGGDEKVIKENAVLKTKYADLESQFTTLKTSIETEKAQYGIKEKLLPHFEKFEIAPKAKESALKDFFSIGKLSISDDTIVMDTDTGIKIINDKYIEDYLSGYGTPKQAKTVTSNNRDKASETSYGNDLTSLWDSFHKAKTLEEKKIITDKIRALDNT